MTFGRVNKERRVEFGSGTILNVAVKPVLDEETPALALTHVHRSTHVLTRQLDREQCLGLWSFH